jgi:hypothetical protein
MLPGGGAAQHEDTPGRGDEAHPDSVATTKSTKASRTNDLTKANYAAANSFVALTGSLSALHNALRFASRGRV